MDEHAPQDEPQGAFWLHESEVQHALWASRLLERWALEKKRAAHAGDEAGAEALTRAAAFEEGAIELRRLIASVRPSSVDPAGPPAAPSPKEAWQRKIWGMWELRMSSLSAALKPHGLTCSSPNLFEIVSGLYKTRACCRPLKSFLDELPAFPDGERAHEHFFYVSRLLPRAYPTEHDVTEEDIEASAISIANRFTPEDMILPVPDHSPWPEPEPSLAPPAVRKARGRPPGLAKALR